MVKPPLRLLIADDHAAFRAGLRLLLAREPGLELAAEAVDGREALEKLALTGPDVVLMDLSMPAMGGLEAIRAILLVAPQTRVLVLSMHAGASYVRAALRAGARGYVVKGAADAELVAAIREVAAGQLHVDPAVAPGGPGLSVDSGQTSPAATLPIRELSSREREVLYLYARGHTGSPAAELLGLSLKMVEAHKTRGLRKLGLRGRAALVRHAVREGWLAGGQGPPVPRKRG